MTDIGIFVNARIKAPPIIEVVPHELRSAGVIRATFGSLDLYFMRDEANDLYMKLGNALLELDQETASDEAALVNLTVTYDAALSAEEVLDHFAEHLL